MVNFVDRKIFLLVLNQVSVMSIIVSNMGSFLEAGY